MGRFTYQKGGWHLIRAFAKLVHDGYKCKLVLLGTGELKEYKEYRESVKLEKARIRMEKEQQKHIQNINNQKKEIEVKDTVEQQEVKDVPEQQTIKPAVVQPKKQTKIKKHEEPKVLNITKEEHLEPEIVEPQQLKLKYYQPTKHTRLEEKNTTINDI